MTSVKIKFRKSSLENKQGVLYIQLIHKRNAKLITTRFRLFPFEWNNCTSSVIVDTADTERKTYLQNIKEGLKREIQQIYDLIAILEKRGDYTKSSPKKLSNRAKWTILRIVCKPKRPTYNSRLSLW